MRKDVDREQNDQTMCVLPFAIVTKTQSIALLLLHAPRSFYFISCHIQEEEKKKQNI